MRAILATCVALLLAAPVADAHRSPTNRVHNTRHVAGVVWGDVCKAGTMGVSIVRADIHPFAGLAYATEDRSSCLIQVDDRRWDTSVLCIVIAHEIGHLAGYRPPPGDEYVGPRGVDPLHHRDPGNLMHPVVAAPFAPCRRDRIARVAASAA